MILIHLDGLKGVSKRRVGGAARVCCCGLDGSSAYDRLIFRRSYILFVVVAVGSAFLEGGSRGMGAAKLFAHRGTAQLFLSPAPTALC